MVPAIFRSRIGQSQVGRRRDCVDRDRPAAEFLGEDRGQRFRWRLGRANAILRQLGAATRVRN